LKLSPINQARLTGYSHKRKDHCGDEDVDGTATWLILVMARDLNAKRRSNAMVHEVEDRQNKNSVRTAKKTQHFTVTKINWLTAV
jgi:hypothetical protein